jgi:hypothetical protein
MTLLSRRITLALFLLSAAVLAFEINLTRLFSVAQFSHFAFLVVSLALLGFGASGTALALFPHWGRSQPHCSLSRLALASGLSMVGAYILTNGLPFDSFTIAWDRRQVGLLALHLLALATPFFFGGMAVGLLLSLAPQVAGQTYAVNLAGSALGGLIALAAPAWLGGEGVVVLSAWLAASASLMATGDGRRRTDDGHLSPVTRPLSPARYLAAGLLILGLMDTGLRLSGRPSLALLELKLSPYKGLSYALQYPGAQIISQRWNAFSRVDVVKSGGVRSLPGLSYLSTQGPPPQHGLFVDGDDLSPIVLPGGETHFAGYMPAAIAFQLRPQAQALILEPRGGLDITVALALGARQVTAVEVNPLIVEAASSVYADPRVHTIIESDRSLLRYSREHFDVIILSLTTSYHPIRSGAYSLAEDYRYTVEAFMDALERLTPEGLLVVTRWLQTPPSEELRAFALAVTALERQGGDPARQIIAFRGYNTATLLIKGSPFTPAEVDAVRAFADSRAFDLIVAPGLRPDEVNRYNTLPEPVYYQTFTALLAARPRDAWYAAYPFDVTPPTDDRPFFGQFFKWSQAPQVLAELGMTWQPFGGAGYFVLLALLGLVTVLAAALILLPLVAARAGPGAEGRNRTAPGRRSSVYALTYFGLIGLAYLFVEIPLIQRFILFLGQPAYALAAVLFTLLLFSGLGSRIAHRVPQRLALTLVAVMALVLPWLLPGLFALSLGLPLGLRLAETIVVLAPLGLLMGMPFPLGIRWLERAGPSGAGLVAWAWGVNGAASVVSSVLAALLALSFGFSAVLVAGALCYGGAWLTVVVSSPPAPGRYAPAGQRPRPPDYSPSGSPPA